MEPRRRERRVIAIAGAAALVAVGLNIAFSAVAAHRRRKRRGERRKTLGSSRLNWHPIWFSEIEQPALTRAVFWFNLVPMQHMD
jgi:hypothetical protein